MVPNWASELILIADMHREVLFLILPMTVRCGSRKYSAEMKNLDWSQADHLTLVSFCPLPCAWGELALCSTWPWGLPPGATKK